MQLKSEPQNDLLVINQSDFFKTVQQILEDYYLQPLGKSFKINLKNGYIERKIHGAMHACRAVIWAVVMHQFLKEKCPQYVLKSMTYIVEYLKVSEETAFYLILLTLVCHDAARQGEGEDLWEEDSAEVANVILTNLGLNAYQALIFSEAVHYKDSPKRYLRQLHAIFLHEFGNYFDYIRKLIHLGDNLDIIRCVSHFRVSSVLNTLSSVEGFDEALHSDAVIAISKAIQCELFKQGDLLFDSHLVASDCSTYASCKAQTLDYKKVTYEHAENVLVALFEDILQNDILSPYLADFKGIPAQKYVGKIAFDPFIHGTRSSMLALLPKSNFEIMSPIEMMRKHHATPMTGELTRGGYRCVRTKNLGKTSFTKLSTQKPYRYTLETILSQYTGTLVASSASPLEDFKKACKDGLNVSFSNINLLLIYFTRARQSHACLEEVINAKELAILKADMNATLQFYYFIQLLGVHLFPSIETIQELNSTHSQNKKIVQMSAMLSYSFEGLIERIKNHSLNIKEICSNPSQENLRKVRNMLELSPTLTLAQTCYHLPVTQLFGFRKVNGFKVIDGCPEKAFKSMSNNSAHVIDKLLGTYLFTLVNKDYFAQFSRLASEHVIALEDKIDLFNQLVDAPQSDFQITPSQSIFLKNEFPMILLSDSEEKITMHHCGHGEYRSQTNLAFGKDIQIVATDTMAHKIELLQYFISYQLNNMVVILFEDLEKILSSQTKPSRHQYHSDGVPTLKWMAAQKVKLSDFSVFKSEAKYKPCSQLYSEKNIQEVTSLIEEVYCGGFV